MLRPVHLLRLEGLAALTAALGVYLELGGPLWLLVVLGLAPDLSMLAYLAGPRAGSRGYNLAHTYVLPLALAAIGLWSGTALVVQVAAIWAAHIGLDRLAGYGLKYPSGFKDSHLNAQPVPIAALAGAAAE